MSDEHPVVWTKDELRKQLKALWLDMPETEEEADQWCLADFPKIYDYIKDAYRVLEVDLSGLRMKVRDLQENNRVIMWIPEEELVKGFERID